VEEVHVAHVSQGGDLGLQVQVAADLRVEQVQVHERAAVRRLGQQAPACIGHA
jgi:hypothetical protein